MKTMFRAARWLVAPVVMCSAVAVHAQTYPVKPVRIVTGGVGGGADLISRLIAQGIAEPLGQPVIVDNRGSGVVPGDIVAKAAPDGYTLLVTSGVLWIGAFIEPNVPYDVVRDFAPISWTNKQPNVLVVHPALPVKTVRELIALAKSKPGALNYSTGATGSATHLAPELFKTMAKVNMVRIPYKSGATEIADLVGGHVQLTFGTPATFMPHIKSGKVRAVAVASAEPSALFPGLPTIASSGVPGYESGVITGIFATAKTPEAIINRLNSEIVRHFTNPETKQRLLNTGVEAVGSTPAAFAAAIKADMAKWGKLIKDANIRAD
jgi:tripartite-type tricarboxylate transporter receptor subunit TctC